MGQVDDTFGQWVLERRKQRHLTQKALGKLAGYAEITVRQIENNRYKLTRFVVECFVNSLAVESDNRDAIIRFALKQTSSRADYRTTNVEYQSATPFVGREKELTRIMDLLRNPNCRCISIVGLGGVGKTRLALQAVATYKEASLQEIGYVFLREVTTTEQMAQAIATAVGIALTPFGTGAEQVVQALASRDMLLLLDNFEQLLPEGIVFLSAIIAQAPAIKLILTSRERLQISSEWSIRLQGLGMTDGSPLPEAANLFISTAQRKDYNFVVSDIESIYAICQLLQGIPLAIEMAASWTDVYICSEILTSISNKALDLTTRFRDVDERHQSLQTIFDTTWERLSSHERATLIRLAVFRGGFTLAAALEVAITDTTVLAFLQDKMLVHSQSDGRLVLREMIRQLALQKLMLDEQQWQEVRLSHADYYIHLLSKSPNLIKYNYAREEILHISRENENMLVAWDTMLALRRLDWFDLCWEGFWLFFNVTSRFREGELLFRSTADAFGSKGASIDEKHIRDFSHILIASLILRQGRIPESLAMLSAPHMDAIRISNKPFDQYMFYFVQSYILHASGNGQAALTSAETGLQALSLIPEDIYSLVVSYFQMGRVHHLLGNSELAYQYISDSLHLFSVHNIGWGLGLVLTELGLVAETKGQINEALTYYEAVLAAVTEWEEVWNYHRTRINIGRVKLALEDMQEAITIFYSTLQSLQNNPQLGLEIDCFVEIALVFNHMGNASLAILLLEYCSIHPECFQPTRNRAADYLKTFTTETPTPDVSARNLFPINKSDVAVMLLDRLYQIKINLP